MSEQKIDQYWMRHAMQLADKASRQGEVPVGAVIIQNEIIVGEGWNQPISTHDPTAHAEILALRHAGENVQNYRLPDCTLYVTLEPCPMCASALIHARIKRVVFAAYEPKTGAAGSQFDFLPPDKRFNHRLICKGGVLQEENAELLQHFFKQRRLIKKADKKASKDLSLKNKAS